MSDFTEAYRRRLITHQELIERLRPGSSLTLGTWMGQPHGLNRALMGLSPEIDPLYVSISPGSAYGEFLNQANVHCLSTFLGPYERAARRERQNVSFTPLQYTDAAQVDPRQPAPGIPDRPDGADGRARVLQPVSGLELGARRHPAGIADHAPRPRSSSRSTRTCPGSAGWSVSATTRCRSPT